MPNLGNLAGAAQKPLQYNRSQTQEGTPSSLLSAPSHGHNFQRLESCSCSRSWLLMHLVAAVFALTVFALWRASTTKRHTHPHTTHTTTHTHKQKQYKFILPRLLRATALGHSLGAQPAARNLSTARKFRIRSKLALRAIKAGQGSRGGRVPGCQGKRIFCSSQRAASTECGSAQSVNSFAFRNVSVWFVLISLCSFLSFALFIRVLAN